MGTSSSPDRDSMLSYNALHHPLLATPLFTHAYDSHTISPTALQSPLYFPPQYPFINGNQQLQTVPVPSSTPSYVNPMDLTIAAPTFNPMRFTNNDATFVFPPYPSPGEVNRLLSIDTRRIFPQLELPTYDDSQIGKPLTPMLILDPAFAVAPIQLVRNQQNVFSTLDGSAPRQHTSEGDPNQLAHSVNVECFPTIPSQYVNGIDSSPDATLDDFVNEDIPVDYSSVDGATDLTRSQGLTLTTAEKHYPTSPSDDQHIDPLSPVSPSPHSTQSMPTTTTQYSPQPTQATPTTPAQSSVQNSPPFKSSPPPNPSAADILRRARKFKFTASVIAQASPDSNNKYPCPLCPPSSTSTTGTQRTVFTSLGNLRAHVRLHHDKGRTLPCSVCDKTFLRKQDRDRHEATHLPLHDKPFGCEMCTARFARGDALKSHIRRAHGKTS